MKLVTVAVITLVAGLGPAHAGSPVRLIGSAGAGAAAQAIGDGGGGGLDLAGSIGIEVASRTSVEVASELVVQADRRSDDEPTLVELHGFAGAGLRVAVVPRFHLALAFGADKVWTRGRVGADGHARWLAAVRVAAGYNVPVGRHLWLGLEACLFGAPLGGDEATDFPDDRLAVALRLSLTRRP